MVSSAIVKLSFATVYNHPCQKARSAKKGIEKMTTHAAASSAKSGLSVKDMTLIAMSAVLMGADGFVPALAPAFPEMFAAAYDAAASGNIAGAKKYNQLIRKSSSILSMSVNGTAAAKYAISLLGYTDKRVMMPQDPILPEEEEKIRICFDEVNKMFEELKNEKL